LPPVNSPAQGGWDLEIDCLIESIRSLREHDVTRRRTSVGEQRTNASVATRKTSGVSRAAGNKEEVQMSIFGDIAAAIFGRSSAPGATNIAGTSAAGKPISRAEVEAMIETVADGQDEGTGVE